jgi:hypothetical protein
LVTANNFEQLWLYLRRFVNAEGELEPYDTNGVVRLMLALLDNLREKAPEADLEEIGGRFSDEQAEFFLKLARYVARRESDPPSTNGG